MSIRTKRAGSGAAEQNGVRKKSSPTEIREHALERCPDCNYILSGHSIARRREVIDIPVVPPPQVVEHQMIKRWCPNCMRWHSPKQDVSAEVMGQGRIGNRTTSLVSWLRTAMRLPVKQVQQVMQQVYALTLSAGEIVGLIHAVAEAGQPTVQTINQAILAQPHMHMDET